MAKIFIDGSAGTTGLRIRERLSERRDITLLTLPEELRKDNAARCEMLDAADIAFLCLPDAAAKEIVEAAGESKTVIIDTSTAHRTNPAWEYGFPELYGRRERIAASRRIANPGCHASGFIALVQPLIHAGFLPADAALTCFSLTGYTGGGKSMIAAYEDEARDPLLDAPRMYGLSQSHKHLPEMCTVTGLQTLPVFCPIVADFPCGMEVNVPLFAHQIKATPTQIKGVYADYYSEGLVRYVDAADEGGFMSAALIAGRDDMQISVSGNEERMVLTARFDNLGKGASGAAIQNMNICLGLDEDTGLNV
jgi:N-acetyl-gamma-glutamyl-phosphate reductase